ncbi:DUF305 domain-containing protein [Streptomyces sp. NPDC048638]|uniref:DUF305 domain-containing protein n=1 Tax=Streptomyces sp. NPDC048638 TaxID=3365580 RepID=UPI0037231F6C
MTVQRSALRRSAAVATAAVAALVLAACGGNNDDTASSGHHAEATSSASASAGRSAGRHNAADVAFATQMIPHHRQAVTMADLAEDRAASGEVKTLADKIKNAQDPEITTMSGWLTAWGEKVPAETTEGMGDMDHGMDHGMGHSGGSGMPGMMTEKQMKELKGASGKAFDTAFLTMMVGHHEGAVKMARTEQREGAYGPAKTLAGNVITGQSTEITQMNKLLGKSKSKSKS